jgi:hypothetical protein
LLVILFSSLVGFYVKARARDRCLRDFDGFQATVEAVDGKVAWGTLRVYSSGIELLYSSTHQDREGHAENSYILYANELTNLEGIYRFHDHQSAKNGRRRARDIRRTYQPSLLRRAARSLRNLYSAFRDAIVQTLNAILGYRAAQSPESALLSRHKELTASGAQLIGGAIGSAYEPILEHYIGQYVVLDILVKEGVEEEHGILKEYSAQYIELLSVKLEIPLRVYLRGRPSSTSGPVRVERVGDAMRVTNGLERTVLVGAVCQGERSRPVDAVVAPGESVDVELVEAEREATDVPIELRLSVRCLADLIVPRSIAVIRHAGKRDDLTLEALLGLDDLADLPWIKRLIGTRWIKRIGRRN